MSRVNLLVALMLTGSVIIQTVAVILLPISKGFTVLWPSIGASVCVVAGVALVGRAIATGANLSIAVPIVSAAIPLLAVFVGILLYGDPASLPRVLLLIGACAAIGIATCIR